MKWRLGSEKQGLWQRNGPRTSSSRRKVDQEDEE